MTKLTSPDPSQTCLNPQILSDPHIDLQNTLKKPWMAKEVGCNLTRHRPRTPTTTSPGRREKNTLIRDKCFLRNNR